MSRALRLAAAVALDDRGHLRGGEPLIDEAPDPKRRLEPDRDLGLHVGKLLLDQLIGGERTAELLALEHILARRMPAELGRPEGAEGDAEARLVEAAERPLKAAHPGQHAIVRHEHVVHQDLPGGGGAERELALDLGRR
jgi:hypothetical protein